jgi:DNA-binding NarL/FixJ family response regulator
MLDQVPSLQVVGEAADCASAIRLTQQLSPDVLLLDVRLGKESGFTVCRELEKLKSPARVIILTSYSDENTVLGAVSAGVDGYLLKEIGNDALVSAITRVAAGEVVLDPTVRHVFSRLNSPDEPSGRENLDRLSPQERRVLALVAEGKTNKEIGEAMGLSDKTVKNYVAHLLEKLGVGRRSEAAAYYARFQFA